MALGSITRFDRRSLEALLVIAYLFGWVLAASPVFSAEASDPSDPTTTPGDGSDIARWTWLGIVESGGDPLDSKIEPGAPMRVEFVAERTALPLFGSEIHGPGNCEVEANMRL